MVANIAPNGGPHLSSSKSPTNPESHLTPSVQPELPPDTVTFKNGFFHKFEMTRNNPKVGQKEASLIQDGLNGLMQKRWWVTRGTFIRDTLAHPLGLSTLVQSGAGTLVAGFTARAIKLSLPVAALATGTTAILAGVRAYRARFLHNEKLLSWIEKTPHENPRLDKISEHWSTQAEKNRQTYLAGHRVPNEEAAKIFTLPLS